MAKPAANPLRKRFQLFLPNRKLSLGARTLVMGILNVTPDSFSDKGKFFDRQAAVERGLNMEREGADILDIGGESTRPGADPVGEEEELKRVIPVIEALRRARLRIPISVDTYKSGVAEAALEAGAEIVNDIGGLRFDPRIAAVAKKYGAALVLMHSRGTPCTMQQLPPLGNVMRSICDDLASAVCKALAAGISRKRIVIDPGIGFGKTADQNFLILRELGKLSKSNLPVLVGTSRKSFLTGIAGSPKEESQIVAATAISVCAAIWHGAHIVRVHDVKEMARAARIADRFFRR